ncbi:MAG: ATP-binding protein [Anaerolineales bacterium]|nr:ATP-binding protein [Anaerolineales bacterium]
MNIYPRSLFPTLKAALADKRIVVITGMRRVGKTTTLRWLLEQVPSANKIYLDLERLDQRAVFQESNYEIVLDFLRNRGLDPAAPLIVALDEIQYAPNSPSVVKYLYDHYGVKFLLSGSSSYYLKNLFSESMAGRKVVFELLPLRFGEFLEFRGAPYRPRARLEEMRFDPYEFERLKTLYDEYLIYGGLPDVVLEARPAARRDILNDIFSSYINIDVRSLADFQKINELQQLLRLLALRIGNKLDMTKLASAAGLSRPTLVQYLEFLEKTYIIARLPAYAGGEKSVTLGRKLYFCDNGIAGILAQISEGALFENAIFNQLRPYGELAYLSKGSEYEIDFVLRAAGQPPVALEVKYHPLKTDQRRLKRLAEKHAIRETWLIGRYPAPDFKDFLWGGLIF